MKRQMCKAESERKENNRSKKDMKSSKKKTKIFMNEKGTINMQ